MYNKPECHCDHAFCTTSREIPFHCEFKIPSKCEDLEVGSKGVEVVAMCTKLTCEAIRHQEAVRCKICEGTASQKQFVQKCLFHGLKINGDVELILSVPVLLRTNCSKEVVHFTTVCDVELPEPQVYWFAPEKHLTCKDLEVKKLLKVVDLVAEEIHKKIVRISGKLVFCSLENDQADYPGANGYKDQSEYSCGNEYEYDYVPEGKKYDNKKKNPFDKKGCNFY